MIANDPKRQNDWDVRDERTFYTPTFFKKRVTVDEKGVKKYHYDPIVSENNNGEYLYWDMRD